MNELQRIFNGKECFGLYTIFGETPWTRAMSICRTVESLDHPAHALFLMNYPYDPSIPESKRAWDAAWKCCIGPDPEVEMLVHAMRIFCPMHSNTVFPWLRVKENLTTPRSVNEWRALGRKQVSNYKFNEWWWRDQVEAPFLQHAHLSMSKVITAFEKDEKPRQRNSIARSVRISFQKKKKDEAWKKAYREAIHAGRPKPKSIPPIKLTPKDQDEIKSSTDRRIKAQEDTVSCVKSALPSLLLRFPIDYVARAVSAVAGENRQMKWTLRLLFHRASGLRAFDAERILETRCGDDGLDGGVMAVFGKPH
jgi:hypothetical protein